MIVFFVIVGISVVGIAAVFFLLSKEGSDVKAEPYPLDYFKDTALNLSKKAILEEPAAPKKKGGNPFAKFKLPGKKKGAESPDEAPEPPAEKKKIALPKFDVGQVLSKFKISLPGLKKKKSDAEDLDIEPPETPAKKNPLQNVFSKLSLGKKKVVVEDDVHPTNFASLKEKLSQFSKGNPEKEVDDKPIPLRKDTGTVSLKTQQEKPATPQSLSDQEKQAIDSEVDSATELAELKSKYTKMEELLTEKNSELEKNKTTYDSEVGHRKDFNKIKDLLEKELKEVKERVKTVRQDHATAVQEKDNALKRIKVLEDKSTKLEKEIAGLEKENETFRKKMKQAGLKDEPPRTGMAEEPAAAQAPEPEAPPPAAPAAAPMELPPAFREPVKLKLSKDDISKFEESLGFSTTEHAAEAPATPAAPPPAPEIIEPPSKPVEEPLPFAAAPVEEPPAAPVEPPPPAAPFLEEPPIAAPAIEEPPVAAAEPPAAPIVEEPPATPIVEEPPAAVVEPPPAAVPPPFPAAEPPAPAPSEETYGAEPPEREDDDDQDGGSGFLKLSPDPLSGPPASNPAPEPESPNQPEDKKE